jgi:hypothetical protein
MTEETLPQALWQILLKAANPAQADLTCDECFALLEYYSSRAADGEDFEKIKQATRKHLLTCPHCREQHLQRLNQIEQRFQAARRKTSTE